MDDNTGFFNSKITYSIDEAIELLATLENAVEYLLTLDNLHPLAFGMQEQAEVLTGKMIAEGDDQ